MKKMLGGLVVLLVVGAFVAGYWPQRERLIQAQAEANELRRQLSEERAQLAQAEAKARLGLLFGQFLALQDAVDAANYRDAQGLSSAFFDQVRAEVGTVTDATARTALDAVLMRRDTLTAGLARAESSVREVLVPIQIELRRALRYPVLPLAPVASGGPRETAPVEK